MRVAIAQDAPVFLDAAASTDRVLDYIRQAAAAKARLLAFGETWLPGYPFWLSSTGGARFDDPEQKAAYGQYLAAAIEADGPEIRAIEAASREHGVAVVLGFVERGGPAASGSVWASLVFIHPERGAAAPHRKLVPTYEERLAWAHGDAHGLRAHELDGVTVTALNCWENWMPLARNACYAQGSQVHVAIWPGSPWLTQDITRFVAREGRVFCVSASGMLGRQDVADSFALASKIPDGEYQNGGSCVAGPDGAWVLEPHVGERGLLVADLDVEQVARERQNFDPTGHYARPDLFAFRVDRRRPVAALFEDGDDASGGAS